MNTTNENNDQKETKPAVSDSELRRLNDMEIELRYLNARKWTDSVKGLTPKIKSLESKIRKERERINLLLGKK